MRSRVRWLATDRSQRCDRCGGFHKCANIKFRNSESQGDEVKKNYWVWLGVVTLLAGSIGAYVLTGQSEIGAAKASLRAQMKDPDSVIFSDLKFVRSTEAVCGQVNAKNSYGGYVGLQRFVRTADGELYTEPEVSPRIL